LLSDYLRRGQRSHSSVALRHGGKEDDMNVTLEGSSTLSPLDLRVPRSNAIVIGFWTVTALFCLQIGFTAWAQLQLPQVAEAFSQLGFPDYFRVELAWAKLLGVVLLLAPVSARLKEWAYAGFAITLGSALIAHFAVGDGPEAWGFAAATGVLWGLSYFFWRRLEAMTARA
jgi:DoxX-like family